MARRRRKFSKIKEADSIADMLKWVGQIRYVEDESRESYYAVKVLDLSVVNCGIKAQVEIVEGIGNFEICASELYTKEEAERRIEYSSVEAQRDAAESDIMRGYYQKERRAAFLKLVDEMCSEEEKETLIGEAGGAHKINDYIIRNHLRRLLERKYKTKQEESEDDAR